MLGSLHAPGSSARGVLLQPQAQGRLDEAAPLLQEELEGERFALGPAHKHARAQARALASCAAYGPATGLPAPRTARCWSRGVLVARGEARYAARVYRGGVALARGALAGEHRVQLALVAGLALALQGPGQAR